MDKQPAKVALYVYTPEAPSPHLPPDQDMKDHILQLVGIHRYLSEYNYTVTARYLDAGSHIQRDAMREAAHAELYEVVVLYSYDYLAENLEGLIEQLLFFLDFGIPIVAAYGGDIHARLASAIALHQERLQELPAPQPAVLYNYASPHASGLSITDYLQAVSMQQNALTAFCQQQGHQVATTFQDHGTYHQLQRLAHDTSTYFTLVITQNYFQLAKNCELLLERLNDFLEKELTVLTMEEDQLSSLAHLINEHYKLAAGKGE